MAWWIWLTIGAWVLAASVVIRGFCVVAAEADRRDDELRARTRT
jgi:hypothetical protein